MDFKDNYQRESTDDSEKYLTYDQLPPGAISIHTHGTNKEIEACIKDFIKFNKEKGKSQQPL